MYIVLDITDEEYAALRDYGATLSPTLSSPLKRGGERVIHEWMERKAKAPQMMSPRTEELVRLCLPVVAYMRKTCTPHDTLIVTDGQVRMVSDEFSEPVSECADREAAEVFHQICEAQGHSEKTVTIEVDALCVFEDFEDDE